MTLHYEQIFTSFSELNQENKEALIDRIRQRRLSDNTPKKQEKQAKADTRKKQSKTEKWRRTLQEMTPEEHEQLLKELEDASKNS